MKFDATNDTYTLSSGRTFYANLGILGVGPGHGPGDDLLHGYDGGVDVSGNFGIDPKWTDAERAEVADEMIARWTAFKAVPAPIDPADESTRMSAGD